MIKFFKQAFEAIASRSKPTPKPTDDGPVLEMTIPMPEVGVGVPEFLADQREEREKKAAGISRADMKRREVEAKLAGQWAEPPPKSTPTAVDWEEMRVSFQTSARSLAAKIREEEKDRESKRDRGMSM